MRPLTDHVPKALLEVCGKPLVVYLIEALAAAGHKDIVINVAHLGDKIREVIGSGQEFGVNITFSPEDELLESGGGIFRALPFLDSDPFLVVNGDIWTDFPFARLPHQLTGLAHLVLVNNPAHHPQGDFVLHESQVFSEGERKLTFSGIGVYRQALFQNCNAGKFPLAPLLRTAMTQGAVRGEYYAGQWIDVGTPQRLHDLNQAVSRQG
jgi:MurNAc alpha-1-phosphate uridylyltransferase